VSLGFEEFVLRTTECESRRRDTWLVFGGDVPTPTVSTVNDQERPVGKLLKVNGVPIPLVHDAALDLFRERLTARRLDRPNGKVCGGDTSCQLYDVTATFRGIFFAADNRPLAGYGHMGCCHLLAIEQVADVDAQRTAVPAGGRFKCSTDEWKMDSAQVQQLKRRSCQQLDDCQKATAEQVNLIANHWGETINADKGTVHFLTGVPSWESPDLLKGYYLNF
jgi:hypothetical protein